MKLLTWLVLASVAVSSGGADAAELKIFTARALATVLEVVGPQFEKTSGHKLNIIVGFTPEYAPRIKAGEAFDVLMSPPAVIDGFIKDGKLKAYTRMMLVSSDVGVGVKAGAPKPDISTVEAFKATVLKAKSVSYLPVPGVPQLLERLGIADAVKPKATIPNTDIVSELVAKGEVEMVIVVVTQILTTPGVELVGPLPAEIKLTTTFGGAVSANSANPDAALALLKFLRSEDAIKVIRSQGMMPAD
jgi:molybdate transport system substrate-binding protein